MSDEDRPVLDLYTLRKWTENYHAENHAHHEFADCPLAPCWISLKAGDGPPDRPALDAVRVRRIANELAHADLMIQLNRPQMEAVLRGTYQEGYERGVETLRADNEAVRTALRGVGNAIMNALIAEDAWEVDGRVLGNVGGIQYIAAQRDALQASIDAALALCDKWEPTWATDLRAALEAKP